MMRKSAADTMSGRGFISSGIGLTLAAFAPVACSPSDRFAGSAYRRLTDAQWRARLPEASYLVLRQSRGGSACAECSGGQLVARRLCRACNHCALEVGIASDVDRKAAAARCDPGLFGDACKVARLARA